MTDDGHCRPLELAAAEVLPQVVLFATPPLVESPREREQPPDDVFGDVRPASTLIEVGALIEPELVVEIEAEAVVNSE